MPPPSDGEQALELALIEARRALDRQATRLTEVHSRAVGLVQAASVAASFLGAFALAETDGPSVLTVLAGLAFLVLIGSVSVVLMPRHEWKFTQDANAIIEVDVDTERPYTEVLRGLATDMASDYTNNETLLKPMYRHLRIEVFALAAVVTLLGIDLAWRG